MSQRPLTRPSARMMNHLELVYAPGERDLARTLLEELGFRVIDPQKDPIPENLGPAGGPFLIVYIDPENDDVIDNVLYASEAREDQKRFESALRDRLAADKELASLHANLCTAFKKTPQTMMHFGVAFPSPEEVKGALERIAGNAALKGRVTVSKTFEPGGPGSVDERVFQGFVYTDVLSAGLLCVGLQIELQVRLDGV